ncbi:ribonuclease Z [Robertkochia flava]|uniref:ribonuclease Z n=1 Tax=Robertkochia flava TaxID=3447986 RepID=UPI001CCF659A|nr:ribonuclease Z [Robertkochia marina]
MIVDRNDSTTLITQESISLTTFRERFREAYDKFKNDNIIVNLLAFTGITANDLMELHEVALDHMNTGKSFVIVNDSVNYDDVNTDLIVVPTVKEAYDLIEMDEIARDLDA